MIFFFFGTTILDIYQSKKPVIFLHDYRSLCANVNFFNSILSYTERERDGVAIFADVI